VTDICHITATDICHITVTDICQISVTDMLWGQIPICCRYVTELLYIYFADILQNCDIYLSHICQFGKGYYKNYKIL
jgi:hypothetical protein